MGLVAHTIQEPLEFLSFLKRFFEEAAKDPMPNPYLSDVPNVLVSVLDHDPTADREIFDFFVHTVEVCQEYYTKRLRIPGLNRVIYAPAAMYLGPYILHQYQREGTVRTDWLETRINAAFSRNDIPFFESLLKTELPLVGIEMRRPRIVLDALALFFNSCNANAKIGQMIQSFLARLRIFYPDEVDDFLEEQQAPEEFRLQVRTNEPIETVGELIGIRSWNFFRDDVIVGSPTLRAQLIRVLARAAECKNARAWIDYAIREVINLVYGAEALRQAR